MRLCFGTFAKVLNCCSKNVNQAAFIARIVKVIDPESRYVGENRYEIIKQEQKKDCEKEKEKIIGDKPVASKLLSCKINFIFSQDDIIYNLDQSTVINNLKRDVTPFIEEDKKVAVILTLLHIIQSDKYIDYENKENFKKYFGVDKNHLFKQSKLEFSDFLGKILLYTTCCNVENIVGKECIEVITSAYIDDIAKHYTHDFQWDIMTQTLTLPFVEIFDILNQDIEKYQIHTFIEKVDPTVNLDIMWIKQCNEFIKVTEEGIWKPFAPNLEKETGKMLKTIQLFARTLKDYTEYLENSMRPIDESPQIYVPIYRDENMEWALAFSKKTIDYRQKLISIYQEVYQHATFYAHEIHS